MVPARTADPAPHLGVIRPFLTPLFQPLPTFLILHHPCTWFIFSAWHFNGHWCAGNALAFLPSVLAATIVAKHFTALWSYTVQTGLDHQSTRVLAIPPSFYTFDMISNPFAPHPGHLKTHLTQGPKKEPCAALCSSSIQVDMELFVFTCWEWLFSQIEHI